MAIAGLLVAGQAMADTCWRRVYTDSHMASQPKQTVRVLQVRLPDRVGGGQDTGQYGDAYAEAWAIFRDSGQVYRTGLFCYPAPPGAPRGAIACGVECDGGSFLAWRKTNGELLLRTHGGFVIQGGCGEAGETRWVTDRGASKTTFKLFRVDLAQCR